MAGRYPSMFLFSRFLSEIDRLFGEALAMGEGDLPAAEWQPTVDIVETPEAVLLLAEVPGLTAADLTIEVKGMHVMVSGSKPTPCPAAQSPRFLRVERGSGRFVREVQFFWPVNSHAGSARLADGLLTITFPKVQEKRQAARVLAIVEDAATAVNAGSELTAGIAGSAEGEASR